MRRSQIVRSSCTRAMTGGSWARRTARWSPSSGDPRRGDGGPGQRPGARQCCGVDHLAGAEGTGARPQCGGGDGGHAPERDGLTVAPEVGEGDLLEGSEGEGSGSQGAGQRMRGAGRHEIGATGDHAGLGPAEQLVAAEGHDRRAVVQGLAGRRLARQPGRWTVGQPRARGIEQPRADVVDEGDAERREQLRRHGLREALDAVVRGVHLQHQGDVGPRRSERDLVVGQAGAVGGAHVDQAGAGLLEHLGHAEPAADLHALAPAHDHVATSGQCGDDEQHGGGVVVHHDRRLGAAQPGQQPTDVVVPRTPLAGVEVELEVPVAGRLSVAERRPPEVGVEQDAGGVDQWAQQRPLEIAGAPAGRLGVARRDRRPGHVDQQRVGQARVDQGAGQGVDRGRAHHRRFSLRSIRQIVWPIVLAGPMGDFAVACDREVAQRRVRGEAQAAVGVRERAGATDRRSP